MCDSCFGFRQVQFESWSTHWARGSAAQISSTDRDRRRGMSSEENFGLVVCILNLVWDFSTYLASAPQGVCLGAARTPCFSFSTRPVLLYVLCSAGLLCVRLLRKSEGPAGLTVSLNGVYVCCSERSAPICRMLSIRD